MALLDKINKRIEILDGMELKVTSLLYEKYLLLKALKASREFFEKTMEAEYGEDIGEIMQQWDECVSKELE